MKFSNIKFWAFSSIASVYADVPSECTRDQVYGTWDFHVSAEQQQVNVFKSREICTHMMPNRQ